MKNQNNVFKLSPFNISFFNLPILQVDRRKDKVLISYLNLIFTKTYVVGAH